MAAPVAPMEEHGAPGRACANMTPRGLRVRSAATARRPNTVTGLYHSTGAVMDAPKGDSTQMDRMLNLPDFDIIP